MTTIGGATAIAGMTTMGGMTTVVFVIVGSDPQSTVRVALDAGSSPA